MTRDAAAENPNLVPVLAAAAARLAAAPQSRAGTLARIVAAAAETVPGAEQAGISMLHGDHSITSQAVSHATIEDVDQMQATYREGPCVTALWEQHMVVVEDLAAETRWPRFAPAAAAAGVGSMLSFQLSARAPTLGALNLYAGRPHSFTDDSHTLGGLFALHAAAALGEAEHVAQLQQALASRDVIGQAKGILMERFDLDAEQAFDLLVSSSQESNMKLSAVAQWLTTSPRDGPTPST